MGPGVNLGKKWDSGRAGDIDNSTSPSNLDNTCLPLPSGGPRATRQSFVRWDLAHIVAQGRLVVVVECELCKLDIEFRGLRPFMAQNSSYHDMNSKNDPTRYG